MSLPLASPLFGPTRARARRRVLLIVIVAVLLGGIAQAAHYHKNQLAVGSNDVHCLLCEYAGGRAIPPAPLRLTPRPFAPYRAVITPTTLGCVQRLAVASYDARGPPTV